MKPRNRFIVFTAICIAAAPVVHAADVIKANNTDALNLGTSWTGGITPGTGDVAVWDSTVTSANTVLLGGNLSWGGLRVGNAADAVSIGGSNSLTLGSSGLNTGSSVNLTLNNTSDVTLNGALSGSTTLTLNSNATKNWTGMGNVGFTGTLVLRGGTGTPGNFSGNWLAFGSTGVSQTGSFHLDTGASLTDRGEIIVTDGWGDGVTKPKLTLASLTGFGDFRSDWGANTFRTVLVNQTVDTTFNGRFVSSSTSRGIDLEKSGGGKLTLSGINNLRTTTVNGGTLRLTASSGGTGTIRGTLNINSGATVEIGGVDVLGYSTGSDAVRTINMNGGTLVQTQNRNETNTAVINMAGGSTISATGGASALFDMFGGTAAINSSGDATNTISSPLRLRQNSTTLTVANGAAATDLLISGAITELDGSRGLLKAGSGTLKLTGASNFTGSVTVNAGVIQMGGNSATYSLGASNTSVTKVLVNAGGTVDFNGVADVTYGYTIAGSGASGTGALVNTGAAIGNGQKQASNIRLSADASIGGSGNWALLASGYGATTLDLNGNTLTKTGANTIYLTNSTITAGTIRVSEGKLGTVNRGSVGSSTAVILDNTTGAGLELLENLNIGSLSGGGTAGGNASIASDKSLTVGALGTSTSYAGAISGGGILAKTGSGTLNLSGNNTYTGNTTVSGGVLELSSTGKLYNDGFNNSAVITVNEGGTWRMPDYSYAGMGKLSDYAQRRVLNGGTIEVTGNSHSSGQDFTVTAQGGTFRYTATGQTLTLTGNGNTNTQLDGTLTFDATGNIVVSGVSAVLQGTGGLTKTGAGTLTLGADNTYAGNTNVTQGTLVINGRVSTGNLTVQSGASLMGSGAVGGATSIAAGAYLSPGNSPEVMTFESTLGLNGTTILEIGGLIRGGEYDGVDVAGLLSYGGALSIVSWNSFSLATAASYQLFGISGGSTGSFDSVSVGGLSLVNDGGGIWSAADPGDSGIVYTFTQSTGQLVVIPEPGAALLGGLGLVLLLRRRR